MGDRAWGATHYTHWFQPLTGATAEKHDAFFDIASRWPRHWEKLWRRLNWCSKSRTPPAFQAAASEIPLRRGGTLLGIRDHPHSFTGRHLCIPTIFVSYTGEALGQQSTITQGFTCRR